MADRLSLPAGIECRQSVVRGLTYVDALADFCVISATAFSLHLL